MFELWVKKMIQSSTYLDDFYNNSSNKTKLWLYGILPYQKETKQLLYSSQIKACKQHEKWVHTLPHSEAYHLYSQGSISALGQLRTASGFRAAEQYSSLTTAPFLLAHRTDRDSLVWSQVMPHYKNWYFHVNTPRKAKASWMLSWNFIYNEILTGRKTAWQGPSMLLIPSNILGGMQRITLNKLNPTFIYTYIVNFFHTCTQWVRKRKQDTGKWVRRMKTIKTMEYRAYSTPVWCNPVHTTAGDLFTLLLSVWLLLATCTVIKNLHLAVFHQVTSHLPVLMANPTQLAALQRRNKYLQHLCMTI